MEPDFSRLTGFLDENGVDGYLIHAASAESDQRYLSGFDAPDPFVTLYTPDGTHLLVSELEYGRARKEGRAETVARYVDYGYNELRSEYSSAEAFARMVAAFLNEHGVQSVSCPGQFPLGTADGLREQGIELAVDNAGTIQEIRAVKTDEEIAHLRKAQKANEAAMAAAEGLLEAANVEDGMLTDEGEVLTSERIKLTIERTLLDHGCSLDETIVACGTDAADPHNRGSGPLAADEAIIIDIFPRDKETKYHADMTRTFVVGEPTEEMQRRYDVTHEAFEAALAAVEPGVTGADVHDAVCDVYEEAGYPTLRDQPTTEVGFIHSTGHGVGLDVHELPRIARGGEELQPGHAITIEPGLYDPEFGGVRIEDFVVVTEDGYENLTEYPIELVVD